MAAFDIKERLLTRHRDLREEIDQLEKHLQDPEVVSDYNQADAAVPPGNDGNGATFKATEIVFPDIDVQDGELNIGILDHGLGNPPDNATIKGFAIMPRTFAESGAHWSSSFLAYYPGYAWVVGFSHGYISYDDKVIDHYVRAVRSGR